MHSLVDYYGKLLQMPNADLRLTEMTSSIVSDITPVDNNGDKNVDILYAADVGGRIWRIDLLSDGNQVGTVLADLNDGTVAGNTRFFNSPDVSYVTSESGEGIYIVGIGSGYRAHPLNILNEDHYYVLFDKIDN